MVIDRHIAGGVEVGDPGRRSGDSVLFRDLGDCYREKYLLWPMEDDRGRS